MFYKSRIRQSSFVLTLVAMLLCGGILPGLPYGTPAVYAQTSALLLRVGGPTYTQAGQNLTYEVTIQNMTSQVYTNVAIYNDLPANTTYVSGGALITDNGVPYVQFTFPTLAAKATQKVTWVAKANSGLAVGTIISNDSFGLVEATPAATLDSYPGPNTKVEVPGTLVSVYKNASGTAFNVNVHGYQFENYGNPGVPNLKDDLTARDVFELFGPGVCQSGTTATNCVLSGPAQSWLANALKAPEGGHCDGMAATSLRLFNALPFRQYNSPATFQAGAANTINLNFPAQPIENYITHYFQTQNYIWDAHFAGSPVEIVQKLTQGFNQSPSVGYTVSIFKTAHLDREDFSDWAHGHTIVAYGIETVSATETRILVYDNNYPKQRQYITVNPTANTWRYVTASTPGEPEDAYEGTAVSGNLRIVPVSARDLPAGEYFPCPFCPGQTVASADASASAVLAGDIDFQFTGEGNILIVNDAGQKTGTDLDTGFFVNEIPGAEVFQYMGGLGKAIPPLIGVPVAETDETYYAAVLHGTTVVEPISGTLSINGPGFSLGVKDVQLEPDDVLKLSLSPDGDFIAFNAEQTMTAPPMYIAYDPVIDSDPSIIFTVEGVILDAGEQSSLTLDPALERVYFDDTGALGQQFDVTMTFVWPDGDTQDYVESIDVPVGATSAFIDFGAWDGLLSPSKYVDNILQNPLANHRLKLLSSTGAYDPTPRANAPAGVYHVEATFANVTEVSLADVYFTVADLGAGNLVLNAVGGPAGVGAEIAVPEAVLGDDGLLTANESFTLGFDVGLASTVPATLTVDANGEPWDWTPHVDPPPAYDANNESFVFTLADTTPPTVTINQAAGQADPASSSPLNFTVVFNEAVTDFTASDVNFSGSTAGGTLSAAVTGGPTTYNVAVSGMTTSGAVVATVPANSAVDTAGNNNTASTSTDNTVTFDQNGSNLAIMLSSDANGKVPGLSYRDEDIIAYDSVTGLWSLVFDGSDVGLGNNDIDAFAFVPGPGGTPQLLLSVEKDFTLNGFGAVDDADILKFIPSSYGPTTTGSYVIYFDGSDVDLNSSDEDVDAISFDATGNLLISVDGSFKAQTVRGNDEDLFVLTNFTPGANTGGTWGFYFDGSDVSLSSSGEDIAGLWTDHANSKLYLTTHDSFSVPGVKGNEEDILLCQYTTLGDNTACTFSRYWHGEDFGFDDGGIDGLAIGLLPTVINASESPGSVAVDDTVEVAGDDSNEANPLDGEEMEDEEVTQNNRIFLPLIGR